MKVKICGITDLDTALYAVSHGADAIGFVFAESKRRIDPFTAGEISEQLPSNIEKIGVFVNETKERIEEIVLKAKLSMVQLHGDESPEFCNSLTVPVIKAFSIGSEKDLLKINQYSCERILLDSPKGRYRGGNGTSFNWKLITGSCLPDKKIILAGGLNPGNVEQAIQICNPFMVDVSSGVETDGRKDVQKMKVFLEKVKNTSNIEEEIGK